MRGNFDECVWRERQLRPGRGLNHRYQHGRRDDWNISSGTGATLPSLPPGTPPQLVAHKIGWDHYTLKVDGKTTPIWSGEFHPFRLPSPGLWLDILQKLKANGFNAVSIYFDWGYSSAKAGTYDFTGIRDMDTLLDMAAQVGPIRHCAPRAVHQRGDRRWWVSWLVTHAER